MANEMNVLPYADIYAEEWDLFVACAINTTLLHTRRFLSYHGSRFKDCSLMIRDNKGKLLALFPAAFDPCGDSVVVSHPGATYGGLVRGEKLCGESIVSVMEAICDHYAMLGSKVIRYKAVPHIYHSQPAEDDLYALFRLNAKRYRCDLSASIKLAQRGEVSERRHRGLRKAIKNGLTVAVAMDHLDDFWGVLAANLNQRHETKPVHSFDEMRLLVSRFPEEIELVSVFIDGSLIAGVLLFHASTVSHAQYIASSEKGFELAALDMVFEHCIGRAIELGKTFFDFGINNENAGLVLNDGLYRFKSGFGAGGVVHEFYEMSL